MTIDLLYNSAVSLEADRQMIQGEAGNLIHASSNDNISKIVQMEVWDANTY